MESEKERNKKWFEVFSGGDVWALVKVGIMLIGRCTHDDVSDYAEGEVVDNGVSDLEEKARIMGLIPVQEI